MFNILVVEDDRKLRNLFCTVLSHSGYCAISAENGMSALEILDTEYIDLKCYNKVVTEVANKI